MWFALLTRWGRARQDGRHFADGVFKCIFLNENVWFLLKISLKCVPKDRINSVPALVQIMAWRRAGDKPLSEPMMLRLPTHICVTRPQWVKHVYMKILLHESQIICYTYSQCHNVLTRLCFKKHLVGIFSLIDLLDGVTDIRWFSFLDSDYRFHLLEAMHTNGFEEYDVISLDASWSWLANRHTAV